MSFKVKNNGQLRQLALALREAPKRIQAAAAAEIKREVEAEIDRGFQRNVDPAGNAWQRPKDGGPTMQRTGALRRGFTVEVVFNGIGLSLRISNAEAYAKWLQRGTEKLVPRKMVPDAALPPSYKKIFDTAYANAIAAWYATTSMRG